MSDFDETLMAKSVKDGEELDDAHTLAGHSLRVAEAADALFSRLRTPISESFEVRDPDRLRRLLVLAALFHDLGKATGLFQRTLQAGPPGKHPFMHEIVSAALLYDDGPLSRWVGKALSREDLAALACVVASHHLRAEKPLNQSAGYESSLTLKLGSDSLDRIWDRAAAMLGESPPELENRRIDVRKLAVRLMDFEKEATSLLESWSPIELSVAKSLLVTADSVGSACLEDAGESIEQWLGRAIQLGLRDGDLEHVIADKLDGNDPYDFQEEVRDTERRVALVTAGCGNGKTLAAYMWAKQRIDGNKLVFCYPTTGTSSAGFKDYLLAQSQLERKLLHSRASVDVERMLHSVDESPEGAGERDFWAPDVFELWSTDVMACTVDSALSLMGYWRKAMTALPVWSQALFVFDEIHAYDRRLFGALLDFLRVVERPVLLMTASLGPSRLQAIEDVLEQSGEPTPVSPIRGKPEIENAPRYRLGDAEELDVGDQIDRALEQAERVLYVANTVNRARSAYEKHGGRLPAERAHLYHSRFKYEDRVERQQEVLDAFDNDEAALVVATQVCEMSLDISADLLVTEVAPLPALVQRLGRLNREEREPDAPALALVIEPEDDLPYTSMEDELRVTRDRLERLTTEDALSQADLAAEIESYDEVHFARYPMPFGDSTVYTTRRPVREHSHGVTILREEDVGKRSYLSAREATKIEISMPGIPDRFGEASRKWNRIRGRLIVPEGLIQYDKETGAAWNG